MSVPKCNISWKIATVGVLVPFLAGCAGYPDRQQASPAGLKHAFSLLESQQPSAQWDIASAIQGDFDCDRRSDFAFLGTAGGDVYIGMVRGANEEITTLRFPTSGQSQDALCPGRPKLAPEPLDYDPTESVGRVPGFVRSKNCMGLVLRAGECDDIHIFWNRDAGRLDWWRA